MELLRDTVGASVPCSTGVDILNKAVNKWPEISPEIYSDELCNLFRNRWYWP